jgi:succinate dehydrogenase hydrophobic anchor subunit
MMEIPSVPKPREGAWLWMFKIFAGLMIVIILAIHLIVNHLVAPSGLLSYEDVVRYYNSPLIVVMEIIFLVFVVSHALVGMRSILLDLNPSDRILRLADVFMIGLGTVSIAYGTWLALVIASR